MENMKRAISLLLALVLVLGMVPGVPVTASAEEVESQPEPPVVETTEAPAAQETAPETTAVPEQTEPETLPPETEAESLPQETEAAADSAETEPPAEEAEAQEPVKAEEEAANAAPDPTEIRVRANKTRTYVGDPVKLSVTMEPDNAVQTAFTWELIDEAGIAKISETGVLTATAPGKVKVRARSTRDTFVVSEEVEVTFVTCRIQFNLAPIDEDFLLDTDGNGEMDAIRLRKDASVQLTLKYQTNETGLEKDWVTEYLLEPDVEWERSTEVSEDYASLKVDSTDSSVVTLKGKTVTETKRFVLKATDAIAGKAEITVYICPDPEGVEIRRNGEVKNGKTITIDLGKYDREEYQFRLSASVVPGESIQKLKWKSSSEMIAGIEVVEDSDGQEVIVSVGGERLVGESTLTAICEEDSSVRATVTIKTVDYLQQDEMAWHSTSKAVTDLVAGKSVRLKALDITDPDDKQVLTSEQVEWSVRSEDKAYAEISQNGVLTARNVVAGKDIVVYCRVIGNEENAFLRLPVTIRPKATYIRLLNTDGDVVNSKTLYVNTAGETVEPFSLDFWVAPQDDGEDRGALQKLTWESSNTAIAKVDAETGEITWKGKNGTVTITAYADDGSDKSAYVKIKFGTFAEKVEISCPVEYVRSGESVRMDRIISPSGASAAKLTWSLADGDEKFATISSSGKLTVKTIYERRYITVTAVAEGSRVRDSVQVQIRPAKDRILTLMAGDKCVTKTTQQLDKSTETIVLTAYIVGEDSPEDVTWKYSGILRKIDDDHNGTAEFALKGTGTGTITATSKTTGKTATVTIKGIRKTARVRIIEQDDMDLAAGQSMTLKAKLYDDEGETPTRNTVKWYLEDETVDCASITSTGKLTAQKGYRGLPVSVTIVARATDGSGVKDTCQVTIRPEATGVVIQKDGVNKISTTYYLDEPGEETFKLTAPVYPLDRASQSVKWTSSNKKIATVSSTGTVTCVGTGTVTIKAAAQDGSGEYATLKLTIRKPVYEISFSGNRSMIAGGKTLTLEPEILAADGKKPSSTAVTWSIEGDTSYVTSFKKGVLKTKKVTERKYVTITVKAKDGSEVENSWNVTICPATTSVHILDESDKKVGTRTLYMRAGDKLDLGAISYPCNDNSMAAQTWTWSTSNKSYATVDSDGVVTAKKGGYTVTIKAKAKDGTGKYDTVKIKILK